MKHYLITLAIIATLVLAGCGASSTTTHTPVTPTATSTPTATPLLSPTPTLIPTDTPSPTPTVSLKDTVIVQVTQDAQQASLFGTNITATYLTDSKSAVVTETLKDQFDNAGYRTEIESDCFTIQNSIWHDGSLHLAAVEIHMLLNYVNGSNGQAFTKEVAICNLKASTEATFNWSNMNGESAWQAPAYDLVYLDPGLSQ